MTPINAEKNALDATKALLDFSKVRATKLGLKEALEQHPDFPSMNALSDVLNDWQVPNLAARLSPDRLHEIPLPALTYLSVDGGIFAPLRSVNGSVEWLHTQRGWQRDSLRDFAHKWSGVALLIEPNEQSGEKEYTQNRRHETIRVLRGIFMVSTILAVLGLLVSSFLQIFSWVEYSVYYLTGLFKLAGTILSGMLVWYSLDNQNEFLRRVCQINDRTNCQNILSSKAAKLTTWLSWAEVGLFYFAGGLLTLVAGLWRGSSELLVSLGGSLYLLTVFALPYTLWSLYHQWRVARQWCVLCLLVQALLWMEFLVAYQNFGFPIQAGSWLATVSVWKTGVVSFVMIPILWHWIRPQLRKAVSYQPLSREFQKLKFDKNYVEYLFSNSSAMIPILSDMKTIILGNKYAPNTLTVVTNPMCGPCIRMHSQLEKLVSQTSEINIQFIFSAAGEGKIIADTLLKIPDEYVAEAMDDWYINRTRSAKQWCEFWTEKVPLQQIDIELLSFHQRWCELESISATPTLYLSGYLLPNIYALKDIPELIRIISLDTKIKM
jgi:uncharacterized membrane protein